MDLNQTTEPTQSDKIVRQNSLSHADEWIKTNLDTLKKEGLSLDAIKGEYYIFAEMCELWVNRKK